MEIKDYIIIGVSLFVNATVWVIQQQRIKALKERIKLYDVDELKKYVSIKDEARELAFKNMADKLKVELPKEAVKIAKSHSKKILKDFEPRYNEALNYILWVLLHLTEEQREKVLKEALPLNKEIIEPELEEELKEQLGSKK